MGSFGEYGVKEIMSCLEKQRYVRIKSRFDLIEDMGIDKEKKINKHHFIFLLVFMPYALQ